MIRFFKAFPKFIKTAFLSIFRHIAMSLSASSAVTITLILFSAFLMIAGNVSLFTNSIEDDLQIHVVLKADVKTQKKIDEAKDGLEKISGVRRVTFSDKDNELELMIKEKGKEFEMYRGKDNPLCNAFFVSVKDANQIKAINAQIEQLPFVKQSVYGGNSVSKMISVLNTIRSGGLVFVGLLTLLALRNVGAANWYIKVPFMIEGMLIGLMGAVLPCIFTYFGYQYFFDMLNGQIITSLFTLQPIMPFTLQICGILLLGGMLVGLVGSFFSTTKYLRWKR